jgi:hypothetical protein
MPHLESPVLFLQNIPLRTLSRTRDFSSVMDIVDAAIRYANEVEDLYEGSPDEEDGASSSFSSSRSQDNAPGQ